MTWFALVSLIISVIRTAMELWPLIKDALDGIDGMKSARARHEARGRLGVILKTHRAANFCSANCGERIKAFTTEIRDAQAA